jgi:6-pyruvoyltetrahydropterin/6-carboxytetrahydropterin synthase
MKHTSTKVIELGSCAFRQWRAGVDGARPGAGANSKRCSFVHGYQLKAKFWFECTHLDEKNWCVDFGALKELEAALKHQFDHTLCIAQDDPLLNEFKSLHEKGGCDLRVMEAVGIERTAEWCFNLSNEYIKKVTDQRCWVSRVEVWEHDRNSAVVIE